MSHGETLQKEGQIEQQVQMIGYEGVCVCVCVCLSVCLSEAAITQQEAEINA